MVMKWLLFISLILTGCLPSPKGSKGNINLGENAQQGITGPIQPVTVRPILQDVKIENGDLIVDGNHLDKVVYVQLNGKDGGNFFFDIVTKSANQIVAKARQSTTLLAESLMNLVLHEANGSTAFPIIITIPDGTIKAAQLNNMGASDGQVLKYNDSLGKWEPTDLDGLTYRGAWNVNTMVPDLESMSTAKKGDYYVVNIGGDSDLLNPGTPETWYPGDWALYNGSFWERLNNSGSLTDINGLSGPSITLNVQNLADVDITGLNDGQTLVWDNANSKWRPANVLTNAGNSISNSDLQDNAVTNSKIADNSISIAKIQDNAISSAKIQDGSIMNVDINSAANIDATKIGSGIIDNNEYNNLQNTTGNIQTQLDLRLKLDGTSVMRGDINLGGNGITNIKNVGLYNINESTISPIGTSPGQAGQLKFKELASQGNNYVGIKAPDNLLTNILFTLPNSVGLPGDVLQTDGTAGVMKWDKVTISNLSGGLPNHVLVSNATGTITVVPQLEVFRGGTNKQSYVDGSIPYYDAATQSLNESAGLKYDDSNNRLGLGTSLPDSQFHIKSIARAAPFDVLDPLTWADQYIENPDSTTDAATGILFRVSDTPTGYAGIAAIRSAPGAMDLAFITDQALGGQQEVMRITEDARVGINTDAPAAELHVEGDAIVSGSISASDSITVSNIKIEGNTISSVDTNGVINIIPNGTGTVRVGDSSKAVKTSVDLISEPDQESGITLLDGVVEKWYIGQGSTTTNNKLVFRRDGANDDMVIDTNGRVGIGGVISPSGLLSLGSSLAQNKFLIFDDPSGPEFMGMGAQANQWTFSLNDNADKYSFYDDKTQSTEIFTIMGNGNVGVGDSSPEARLGVVLPDSNGLIANDHFGLKLRLNSNQNGDSIGVGFAVNGEENQKYKAGIFYRKGTATNSRGDLILANSNDNDTTSVDTTDARVVIKSDGKVGIGTDTPASKMDISAANDHLRLVESDNSNKSWALSAETSNLNFNETSVGTRVTIEQGGQVGIGTIAPTNALHIQSSETVPFRIAGTSGTNAGLQIDGNSPTTDRWRMIANTNTPKSLTINHFDGGIETNFLNFVDTTSGSNISYFSGTNVGIYDDSPAVALSVGKTSDTVNRVLRLNSGTAAGIEINANTDNGTQDDQNAYLKLISNGSQVGVLGYINQNGKDPFGAGYTDGLNGALLLSSNGNPEDILQLGTSQEARITIDGQGRVGIGTKTPTSRLNVLGSMTQNGGDVSLGTGSLFVDDSAGRVGVGSTISPQAVLDIDSTDSGILLPRMTNAQRDAISSPPESMMIFSITDKLFYYYSGGSWNPVGSGGSDNPIGTITSWAGNGTPPNGWIECDGRAISRTTYSSLFSVLSTSWGRGDNATTFNVPDLRGRFLRHVDGAAGRDPDKTTRTACATGGNSGNNVGSCQADEFMSHNHTAFRTDGGAGGGSLPGHGADNIGRIAFSSNAIGNSGGNETRPINAYVKFIIKAINPLDTIQDPAITVIRDADLDSSIDLSVDDQISLNTAGVDIANFTASSISFSRNTSISGNLTQTGGDVNFDSGTFFVDSSANGVGMGTTSPSPYRLNVRALNPATFNPTMVVEVSSCGDNCSQPEVVQAIHIGNSNGTGAARVGIGMGDISLNNTAETTPAAWVGVNVTNRTNHYGDFEVWTRSSGGYSRKFWIDETGDSRIWGDLTADAFLYSSDERLKENIQTVDSALDKVLQLRGVSFDWKKDGESTYGFIAQEVEQIFPELVKTNDDGYKAVLYGNLVSPVVEAIKEQQEEIRRNQKTFELMKYGIELRVQENERKISSLEKENKILKARLEKQESEIKKLRTILLKHFPDEG